MATPQHRGREKELAMKNTIVGWIALLGLLFVGLMVIVAIATVLDQGGHATVTCNSTETSVTCVRS